MPHEFRQKLSEGKWGERVLDAFFKPEWHIVTVSRQLEKMGIDRGFRHRCDKHPVHLSIEYKTDFRTAGTGKIFFETWSNLEAGTPGWAYTTKAQVVYYFVPHWAQVYVLHPLVFKHKMAVWTLEYETAIVENPEYESAGLLVPVEDLLRDDRVRAPQEVPPNLIKSFLEGLANEKLAGEIGKAMDAINLRNQNDRGWLVSTRGC